MVRPLAIAAILASLSGCASTPALPPRAAELNHTGVQALAAGDLETAESRFSLALEYSPRFVEAWVNLGLVELERGNLAVARHHFGRARRLNPDIAQPHHALGVLEEREGRPDRASDAYQDALAVDPGFFPSRLNWARLLFTAGFVEHARVQLRKAVEVAPDDPVPPAALAEVLIRTGRVTEANALVEQAHRRFPDDPALTILVARMLMRRDNPDGALVLLSPLAQGRSETAVAALGWMATAELVAGRPRLAVGAARRALQMEPDDSVATHTLALALAALSDPGSTAWLARARTLAPAAPLPKSEGRWGHEPAAR